MSEKLDAQELARVVDNLRDQRRAISDVLRAVARAEGLQPVLDEIVGAAMRLCRGEHAQLYLAEGDLFHIVSHNDTMQEAYEYSREHPHARDRTTIVGRVALTGETVQIPDVLADADYSYGAQRIVAIVRCSGFRLLWMTS